MCFSENVLIYYYGTVHSAHITTMYNLVFLKMFFVIPTRPYILLTLLLCTAELFWKRSYLFRGDCLFCSHYYYVQMSFSEIVLGYSEETVHSADITTMYRWVFLRMFLVIPKRQYILLTLLLCTDELFWKCSWLFRRDSTFCSHYYYVQMIFSENILSYSEETVHTPHTTTMYMWGFLKMFLFIPSWPTFCSHYYYVRMSFSKNVISYSEETVHTPLTSSMYNWFCSERVLSYSEGTVHSTYITTMYWWFFLKMFLVIPRGQYILLTFLLSTAEFLWKCS